MEIYWNEVFVVVGVLTGGVALYFSAAQWREQRKHNRLSMKPHIGGGFVSRRENKTSFLGFELTNQGIGPAYITKFQVTLCGKEMELSAAIAQALKDRPYICRKLNTLGNNCALSPKEPITVALIEFPCTSDKEFDGYDALLSALCLRVKYKSGYGDEFVYEVGER